MPYSSNHYQGLDQLIPPPIRGSGTNNERRARLLSICLLVGPSLGFLLSAMMMVLDPSSVLINLPSMVASIIWWLWWWNFRQRGHFNFTANSTVALLNTLILYFTILWGIDSPISAWAVSSLVFATYILDTWPALIHGSYLFGSMLIVLLLDKLQLYSPLQLPPEQQSAMYLVALVSALSFAWLITLEVRFLYARAERKLDKEARTDMLTGLANRRHFFEYVKQQLTDASSQSPTMSILILDVDHFKKVNDTHGHIIGDNALVAVATALKNTIDGIGALPARLAGDEFAIALPKTELATATKVAQQILDQIQTIKLEGADGKDIGLSVSIGISSLTCSDSSDFSAIDQAIAKADKLLFKAKQDGRNSFVVEIPKQPAEHQPKSEAV